MMLWIALIFTAAFAQQTVQVGSYTLVATPSVQNIKFEIQKNKKTLDHVLIATEKNPEIIKLESFEQNQKFYIWSDYSLGSTFGSRKETTCYRASLWELTSLGKLVKKSEVNYKCFVNTSDDYLKQEDYDYKYRLNKKTLKLEFY